MTQRPELRLHAWDSAAGKIADVALPAARPAACLAEMRCLAGASGVHLVIAGTTGVLLRAEVTSASAGEIVPFQIEIDEAGAPSVWSEGFPTLLLPIDARYDPPLPISPAAANAPVDIALVIDGTLHDWDGSSGGRLLDRKEFWNGHADKLADFAARLTTGGNARAAVLAFGDQKPPAVSASDLRPLYRLDSEDEQLLEANVQRVRPKLQALRSTPGADFVDALADALHACTRLRWRKEARKLLVLSGDSPGFSLLHPLTRGADLCVRQFDIDAQALALHRLGVEVVTIYHAPPSSRTLPFERDLLASARSQYWRLASLPEETAFEASAFDPAEAAERMAKRAGAIGRGTTFGELVRLVANDAIAAGAA